MKKQLKNNWIKKILIFRTEHIGDYILSLNAINTIIEKFPNAQIDIVVGPWNKNLVESTKGVNDVFIFDNPLIKRNFNYFCSIKLIFSKQFFNIVNFIKKINKKNYDLIISFSNRKITSFFLKFLKTKRKIDGSKYVFGEIFESERIKKVLQKNGFLAKSKKSDFLLKKEDKKVVNNFLTKNKLKEKTFLILHPISPLGEKNWSLKKWNQVVSNLKSEKFLIIGTKKEKKEISNNFKLKNCINVAGNFNLMQTYYLISKSKRFLGIDSGPMHFANLANIPIIALFGATNEKIWGPTGKKDKVLKKENIEEIKFEEVLKIIK